MLVFHVVQTFRPFGYQAFHVSLRPQFSPQSKSIAGGMLPNLLRRQSSNGMTVSSR